MDWQLNGLAWLSPLQLGDIQQSTYHITVTPATSHGATINPGPLAGVLPQMNELQQWVLCGIALLIISLVGLLIKFWWNGHQHTKEQS